MKGMNATEKISQRIRNFLFENFLFGYDEKDFSNESSFLDSGVIDSTGILELIVFLESEYGISISDMEIIPENMDSVNCVSCFVYKKINNL